MFKPSFWMDVVGMHNLGSWRIGHVSSVSLSKYPHNEDNNIHIRIDLFAFSIQLK